MSDALARVAFAAGLFTTPTRRHQLFSLCPHGTFRRPAHISLARFFAKDTKTEGLAEIAKVAGLDPGVLAELMDEWNHRPLQESLVKLLASRQAEALTGGQDVTQWAMAITRISEDAPSTEGQRPPLFTSAHDLLSEPVKVSPLLGRIIERGCTGQLFGPSGGSKTFVALDMTLAIGTGGHWNGNQCERGLVLYFAGEGHAGLKRRIKAWHKHNGSPHLSDVHVSRSAVSFDTASISTVVAEVRDLESRTGREVALIVIDTLARHITGDENSTQDMSEFVRAVDGLRDAFPGSTALIIHHTGNSAEAAARSRGSSALKAACDFEIQCDKGLLTFTKVKDGEQPEPVEFKLMPVEIGTDEDGQPITSCVVSYGERAEKHRELPLTAGERELLALVKAAPGILSGDLKAALFEKRREKDPEAKYDTLKKAFSRALDGLIEKRRVFMDGHAVREGQGTNEGQTGDMSPQGDGDKRDTLLKECPFVPPASLPDVAPIDESDFVPFEEEGFIQNPDEELPLWREA